MGQMDWEMILKSAAAAVGGAVGYLFGGWSLSLTVLLTFIVLDWVTGMLASAVEGKLSSAVGFRGIAKKVMMLCLVAAAAVVDKASGDGHTFREAVTWFYAANEFLSIVENAGRGSLVPIPDFVRPYIEVLRNKGKSHQ